MKAIILGLAVAVCGWACHAQVVLRGNTVITGGSWVPNYGLHADRNAEWNIGEHVRFRCSPGDAVFRIA